MQIKMFMWEWQYVFQKAVINLLNEVLKILEIQATTNTFLVGIPVLGEKVNHIYFQPEDCGFTSRQFDTVFSTAKENLENDPTKNIFMTGAHLGKAHQDSLYPKALKKLLNPF